MSPRLIQGFQIALTVIALAAVLSVINAVIRPLDLLQPANQDIPTDLGPVHGHVNGRQVFTELLDRGYRRFYILYAEECQSRAAYEATAGYLNQYPNLDIEYRWIPDNGGWKYNDGDLVNNRVVHWYSMPCE